MLVQAGQKARADGATRRNFELLDGWIYWTVLCTWPRVRKSRLKAKLPVMVTTVVIILPGDRGAPGVARLPLAVREVRMAHRNCRRMKYVPGSSLRCWLFMQLARLRQQPGNLATQSTHRETLFGLASQKGGGSCKSGLKSRLMNLSSSYLRSGCLYTQGSQGPPCCLRPSCRLWSTSAPGTCPAEPVRAYEPASSDQMRSIWDN